VYDVTRSETFESLENIWLNEWEMYSTVDSAVKMVVGNKVDLVTPWLVVLKSDCGGWFTHGGR
jgi:hypothetical protein